MDGDDFDPVPLDGADFDPVPLDGGDYNNASTDYNPPHNSVPSYGMNGQQPQEQQQQAASNGYSHHPEEFQNSRNSFTYTQDDEDDALENSFTPIDDGAPQQSDNNNAMAQNNPQNSYQTSTNDGQQQQVYHSPEEHPPQQQPMREMSPPIAVSTTPTPQSSEERNPAAAAAAAEDEDDDDVIEIIDDDDNNNNAPQTAEAPLIKPPTKRPRYTNTGSVAIMPPVIAGGMNSYASRAAQMPQWMASNNPAAAAASAATAARYASPNPLNNTATMNGYNHSNAYSANPHYGGSTGYGYPHQPQQQQYTSYADTAAQLYDQPQYVELPSQFVPMWKKLVPDEVVAPPQHDSRRKAFALSLLNLSEFTITGLSLGYDAPPTPIAGLRAIIKRVSREHGQATFEKDGGGVGGRWKIPLGAYHAFVAYLQSDPNCVKLETIPQMQLKIASLGKARMEKDYPTTEKLIQRGVPHALANTLAPFQRGGVDFVLEREGRALIADEMGLGKTIQSIASMAVYHKEWPLLVLTPSGARYHWESEFRNWLGVNGAAVKKYEDMDDQKKPASAGSLLGGGKKPFNLLRDQQIHVLTSSKVKILPNAGVRIVICSYGLAPMLAQNKQITPGMFRCAIADESHMLKNSKSKRTQFLLPILKACNRVLLLSGTPALSKPAELWPQLQILASEKGFWDDEDDFMDKYVKHGTSERRAELHAMLTGTLMIRRLKDDILKDMPKKAREKAIVGVDDPEMRRNLKECLLLLRQGKGVMAKLARQHQKEIGNTSEELEEPENTNGSNTAATNPEATAQSFHQLLNGARPIQGSNPAEAALEQEMLSRYQQGQRSIQYAVQTSNHQMNDSEVRNFHGHRDHRLRTELQMEYQERLSGMREAHGGGNGVHASPEGEQPTRATVLNKMYSLTGEAKISPVSNFLSKWLADTTKGKICVFAHHITVLDAIAERVGLSNKGNPGTFKFIRIDGKTSPKSRQEQIDRFQTDPSVRVALLGITAAGVAVTLTASSQVLFAELFWTPALMIQAEDRCHRIGQRARVHCKYFVATGTLDEILWKLIEKKFRELGEFVEGKEKLNMIVHKIYKNEEELYKIFDYEDEEGDDDEEVLKADQVASSETGLIPLDRDLEHDIEELGKEEVAMVLGDKDEDDEPDQINSSQQSAAALASTTAVEVNNGPGRSEEDAIALSDDDDEDGDEVEASVALAVNLEKPGSDLNVAGAVPNCKIYKLLLMGPQLGVEVAAFKDRLMVSKILPSRLKRLGENGKPDVGDILVAVDRQIMPPISSLGPVLEYLKKILQRPQPAVLWFAEDADFKEFYKQVNIPKKRQREKVAPKPSDEVVELLDD